MKVTIPNLLGGTTELEIFPLEYMKKPVLTTKQLSAIFGCSRQNITTNFNHHKKEFVEEKDYFFIYGLTLRHFIQYHAGINGNPRWRDKNPSDFWSAVAPNAHDLYLWTLIGAFKHSQYLGIVNASAIYAGTLLAYFSAQNPAPHSAPQPSSSDIKNASYDKRLEQLVEFIDLCKNDDLRDELIRLAVNLIFGKRI